MRRIARTLYRETARFVMEATMTAGCSPSLRLTRRAGPTFCVAAGMLAGCTTLRQTLNPGFGNRPFPQKWKSGCLWDSVAPLFGPGDLAQRSIARRWHRRGRSRPDRSLEQRSISGIASRPRRGPRRSDHGGLAQSHSCTYFNVPFKSYRWLVDFPLESLWLRPIRIRGARREVERMCRSD